MREYIRDNMMKILFVGLGSIGLRHLRNTVSVLGKRNIPFTIDALRKVNNPLPTETKANISNTFSSFSKIYDDYDVAFITNPSSLHFSTLQAVIPIAKAVFIEKPVFTEFNENIDSLNLRKNSLYYVACPLRRSPVVMAMKEISKKEKVFAAHLICSSYLPEWRPQSDYRSGYSAHTSEGGGVRLDIIHEMDYLVDIFGIPEKILSSSGKVSALEIDSIDLANYILRYNEMIATIHLDYFGRVPRREVEFFCNDDTIVGDLLKNTVHYLKEDIFETFPKVDIHLAEINYFFDLLEGKEENINDILKAVATLKLALI